MEINTKASFIMAFCTEKASSFGLMALNMKASLQIIESQEKEYIHGPILVIMKARSRTDLGME